MLHGERTDHVMSIIGSKLLVLKHWSHVVFTVPEQLRPKITTWDEVLALRGEVIRISRDLIGKGGVVAAHTFSSEDPGKVHVHVHAIVFGRKLLRWEALRKRWALFLKRRYRYSGEVVVWENWFLNGREKKHIRERKLRHRIRYILRLPTPEPASYWHFELLGRHQSYGYFGFRARLTPDQRPNLLCPMCFSSMTAIGIKDQYGIHWLQTHPVDLVQSFGAKFPDMLEVILRYAAP